MSDRLAVLPQYLLPKQLLTTLAGRMASARLGATTTAAIRRFVARYGVDMAEAAKCAHPACECIVQPNGPFGKYCSEHCKQAGQKIELRCDCQHPACR